ncbi:MAG TPA: hypothetical protein VMS86_15900 [Thermoanaerobaculia bacterium]|nr:hypothetical protein [Thermoanaerobaculia bacterium]
MEAIRPTLRTALLAFVLLAGLLVAGCASLLGSGSGSDRSTDPDYDRQRDQRITEVRGRVERVDTRDEVIWVEPSGVYRSNLRNEEQDRIALHYDSATVVEYEGRTYQPTALEPGDRIIADVFDDGRRLAAREIEVTYDVSGGDRTSGDRTSDDRYDDRDRRDDAARVSELRGRVRWLDQDRQILELEDASWGWGAKPHTDRSRRDGIVEIHYDSSTVVEFEGRRYNPSNLERGDEVQVEVRDTGTRYEADEILVVANVRD